MNHETSAFAYQKVGITGGTGLVGTALVKLLRETGYQVIVFTRSKNKKGTDPGIQYSYWNWKKKIIDGDLLRSCDYVIHLAGAGVMAHRWTWAYRKEIRNSRVVRGSLIVETLKAAPAKTRVLLGASAIGYYGADINIKTQFIETTPPAKDFLGTVCHDWEQSLQPAAENIRTCFIRTGIVMSRNGGIFPRLRKLFRFLWVPIPGSGFQKISWIHITDLCRLYIYCMQNDQVEGPVNACAPQPILLYQLMELMNKCLKKYCIFFHIPPFMVRMVKGRRAGEILKSTTVNCERIIHYGFRFKYNNFDHCLIDLTRDERL